VATAVTVPLGAALVGVGSIFQLPSLSAIAVTVAVPPLWVG
jgi:hypothetical protein